MQVQVLEGCLLSSQARGVHAFDVFFQLCSPYCSTHFLGGFIFFIFTPNLGRKISILRSICFKWVCEKTPTNFSLPPKTGGNTRYSYGLS